jgi:hypothetical protein
MITGLEGIIFKKVRVVIMVENKYLFLFSTKGVVLILEYNPVG